MVIVKTKSSNRVELIKTSETKLEWKFNNFDAITKESVELADGRKLLLEFRPKVLSQSGHCYNLIPYFRFDPPAEDSSTTDKITIRNVRTGASYNGIYTNRNTDFIGPLKFISNQSINSYLVDGFLILEVETETLVKNCLSSLGSSLDKHEENLIKDLAAIKTNEKFSDFTYRVNDREFPVHKMMLSARSPVFLKMFSTDYKDSTTGVINDISEKAFEDFLRFVYTGKVEILTERAKELLIIADKYEVGDLKSLCELHLLSNLNDDVAIDVFQCAHKFNCEADLKKAAFNHIKKSFAKWNINLPDEFIDAPKAVGRVIMMKTNLENELKVEVAQAERVNATKP